MYARITIVKIQPDKADEANRNKEDLLIYNVFYPALV